MQRCAKLTPSGISCRSHEDTFYVPGFKRLEVPVFVCIAKTTTKSQGQLFGKTGIHLWEDRYSQGQLYVGLSIATHLSNIRVLSKREDLKTKNMVYSEVFPPISWLSLASSHFILQCCIVKCLLGFLCDKSSWINEIIYSECKLWFHLN